VARAKVLSTSADGAVTMIVWDCTAGRFNWFYSFDEMIHVIEGSTVIKNQAGTERRVAAGETIFFPAGSRAEWIVGDYVRKFAVCRDPVPRYVALINRARKALEPITPAGLRKRPQRSIFDVE
jgi:uncharacterized cupin superfamily protein